MQVTSDSTTSSTNARRHPEQSNRPAASTRASSQVRARCWRVRATTSYPGLGVYVPDAVATHPGGLHAQLGHLRASYARAATRECSRPGQLAPMGMRQERTHATGPQSTSEALWRDVWGPRTHRHNTAFANARMRADPCARRLESSEEAGPTHRRNPGDPRCNMHRKVPGQLAMLAQAANGSGSYPVLAVRCVPDDDAAKHRRLARPGTLRKQRACHTRTRPTRAAGP